MKYLKRFASQSLVFGLGGMLSSAVSFVLLPLYTRYLSPADYGVLELLGVTSMLLYVVLSLGMQPAFFRFYVGTEDAVERRRLAGVLILFFCLVSAASLPVMIALSPRISLLLLQDGQYGGLVTMSLTATIFRIILVTPLYLLRAHQEAVRYAVLNLSHLMFNLGLNIWLVLAGWGLVGILWGNLASAAVFSFVAVFYIRKRLEFSLSFQLLRPLLRFGLPFVMVGLGMRGIRHFDRYVLQGYAGSAEVGLLALGSKFSQIVSILIVSPLLIAWGPLKWEILKEKENRDIFGDVFRFFLAASASVVVLLAVLSKELVEVVASPAFLPAHRVVPLLSVSALLYGAYDLFSTGIQISERTGYIAVAVVFGLALKIAIALTLIPRLGMMGAAWSTVGAFGGMCGLTLLLSQRCYRVNYRFDRLGIYVAWCLIIYLGAWGIDTVVPDGPYTEVLKGLLLALYAWGTWVWTGRAPARSLARRACRLVRARVSELFQ